MKDMIGYCGLDCEKYDAYLATVHDDQALREKTAKLWAEQNNAPILPEHINCEGCHVNGVKTVFCEHMCEIRKCARKKGVSTCGHCPEIETCLNMKYVNVKQILPDKLLRELQGYFQGGYIYIPIEQNRQKSWGEVSGYRRELQKRNAQITENFKAGVSVEKLAEKYCLSVHAIRKIIYQK